MKIGVISDTHGLLRPEALNRLAEVDHIIHAGDIGALEVIERLRILAPVTAIRGNNDTDGWAQAYPEEAVLELQSRTILILHDLKTLLERRYDVIVSGHSHKPNIETKGGVLYLNPGSAGPRRFKLPISVAILEIGTKISAKIYEIVPQ
jgi:putative phosphoesterase